MKHDHVYIAVSRRRINRRLGQLSPQDEARFKFNYTLILKEVDAKILGPYLFQENAITLDDLERVNLPTLTSRDRTQSLMISILSSGRGAIYQSFLSALKKTGYLHVAEKLEATDVDGM